MNGVINFYKPPGMSSAQAVAFIKRLTKSKAGHAGTLDPEAAGVLPILLGRATRINDYLMDAKKQYLAEVAFGTATDTQDAHGKVIQKGSNFPSERGLIDALAHFKGIMRQLPPQYSALKVQGKNAYALAREGIEVALEPRDAEFISVDLVRMLPNHSALIRVRCGKGVYIRTLCHDLGVMLGCPAHMRFLLREESSGLTINNAVTMDELKKWAHGGLNTQDSLLTPMGQALSFMPALQVPETLEKPAINGVALMAEAIPGSEGIANQTKVCLYLREDLLGIYTKTDDAFKVAALLAPANENG